MDDVKARVKCPRCGRTLTAGQESCPACLVSPAPMDSRAAEPADPAPRSTPLRAGQAFRGFEIREILGSGGMGVVYKVHQITLQRHAALKVLAPEYVRSPKFIQRFEREARALASLNHPNLVHVYDFGRHDDLLFLAMEYVDGTTLQHRFDAAPGGEVTSFLRLMGGVCDGLERIHRAGLVHRDIKPSNILIPKEGSAKISDFGLAIEADDAVKVTLTGSVIGTPHYMSPEQVLGKTVDGRSDLYSLGVMLYKGLTGRLPFEGASTAVLVRQVQEIPPSPRVLIPALPSTLDDLVMRLLSKAPNQRPSSAREVREQLDAVLSELAALEAKGALVAAPSPRTAEHRRQAASEAKTVDLNLSRIVVAVALSLVGLALALSILLVAVLGLGPGIQHQWRDLFPRPSAPIPVPVPKEASVEPEHPTSLAAGLSFEYYEGEWKELPDFDTLQPILRGTSDRFEIQSRLRDVNFGYRFRGYVHVPEDGEYTFSTVSDDGSKLHIGKTEVVNNDGARSTQERGGIIRLKAGMHPLMVTFFQADAEASLHVYWIRPGESRAQVPASALFHAPSAAGVLRGAVPAAGPPRQPDVPGGLRPGVAYEYFEGAWPTMPAFDTLTPLSKGVTDRFRLPLPRTVGCFGYRFKGYLQVPQTGRYTYSLLSDDGAQLRIGDTMVVDNDGLHGATVKQGQIVLRAGKHAIEVTYFNNKGPDRLEVLWEGPGVPQQAIPASALLVQAGSK